MTNKIDSLAGAINREILPIDAVETVPDTQKKPEDIMQEANAMVAAITQVSRSLFGEDNVDTK